MAKKIFQGPRRRFICCHRANRDYNKWQWKELGTLPDSGDVSPALFTSLPIQTVKVNATIWN